MNVTEKGWQSSAGYAYGSYGLRGDSKTRGSKNLTSKNLNNKTSINKISGNKAKTSTAPSTTSKSVSDTDLFENSSLTSGLDPASASEKSDSSFKMKSSGPSNSVGELAAMLSKAETIMDVQQVMSKAMRALADLKMGAIASEGKEAKKYAQQIKRMEKLIKRIQKKLKHLSKEESMENQRKRALKRAEEQKAREIEKELQTRRKKRRREERRYALKELSEDQKTSSSELMSSMSQALSGASSPDIQGMTGIGDMVSGAAGFSGMEGISVDISV